VKQSTVRCDAGDAARKDGELPGEVLSEVGSAVAPRRNPGKWRRHRLRHPDP
jgi:hypothetical protein